MSAPTEPPCIYPTFRYRDPRAMIAWLKEAFGFELRVEYPDADGGVAHAELVLGSSIVMLGQARDDDYGGIVGGPSGSGGKSLYVAVTEIDALFARASAAGARVEQRLTDRDYGSREFICRDPEGNVWCFGTYWPKADEKPAAAAQ